MNEQEYRLGPIRFQRVRTESYYDLRISIDGDDAHVWRDPLGRTEGNHRQSLAEEIAKNLAALDGRFEVRRYK